MELTKLLGLRPKLQTAESIAAAIAQAEALHGQAAAREAELKAGRGTLLVDGSAKEVEAGERELAEVRAEAERLEVMIEALRPKLKHAQVQEKAAEIIKLSVRAEKEAAAFADWWRTRYPALARELSEGLMMEQKAEQSIGKLHAAASEEGEAFNTSGATIPMRPIDRLKPGGLNTMSTMGGFVRLPPVEEDATAHGAGYIWWQRQ